MQVKRNGKKYDCHVFRFRCRWKFMGFTLPLAIDDDIAGMSGSCALYMLTDMCVRHNFVACAAAVGPKQDNAAIFTDSL